MTQSINNTVLGCWKILLQEVVLAKHYLYPYLVDDAAAIKNPILEALLP